MRVIVCGGRNVGRTSHSATLQDDRSEVQRATRERAFVATTLSSLHAERGFSHIIAGDEGGAERLGLSWASVNEIPTTIYVRERSHFGKETIDQRNARMLSSSNPELIVAIGTGASTARLLEIAERIGLPVVRITMPAQLPSPPDHRNGASDSSPE